MEDEAGGNVVSCAWPAMGEIMGSYLNSKMPFPLPGACTCHVNDHEATVVIHPGLIINTDDFPKQILRLHCIRFLLSFPSHMASFPLGNHRCVQKSAASGGVLDVQWPLQRALLHLNSAMDRERLQEVPTST